MITSSQKRVGKVVTRTRAEKFIFPEKDSNELLKKLLKKIEEFKMEKKNSTK